ncbi:class I SAM-dependent DNA methyltransferase [Piscibacillus salipiscarius]|uniref:Class I SAM-dependent DNA methyltransferase n=1 Tax=Piscibacillus salipiscarius TaxID=299480 RepID=A0ABW5Q6Y6_9BACI|nr:class I SAM-dependent methyltransferase [Piscibacillus salipiscarius]
MYDKLAEVYDLLLEDAPYEEWIAFTKMFLPNSSSRMLDMGCGTGTISSRLSQLGNKVEAFDLSPDMIEVAQSKHPSISFIQEDLRTFNYDHKFDAIISYCDVLNYITNENELFHIFERVYKHLNDDGVFSFDVHSISYINWLIDQEIFSEVREDVSYIWMTQEGESFDEVNHDLTFFVKDSSGLFKRYDEFHTQRAFSTNIYKDLLNQTGFQNVRIYEDFNPNPVERISEDANRIFFVCNK